MIKYQPNEIHVAGLGSIIIGVILSSYLYIAVGALSSFSLAFTIVTVPPLIISSGILFWRYLSPQTKKAVSKSMLATELICWLVIVVFLFLISRFALMSSFEKIGLFSTIFLLASVISLPVVLMRENALKQRLLRYPKGAIVVLLFVVLVSSAVFAICYNISSPRFI